MIKEVLIGLRHLHKSSRQWYMIAESNLPKATEKVVLLSFGEDIIETTTCKTQSKINSNNSLVDISFETLEIHQRRPEEGITFSYVT